MKIKDNVYYVGVNDRTKHLFESLWPLPYGVSYNSYIIEDEKIALVDTVDVSDFEVYIKKIKQVIGEKQIDYLIINHMEPDHSGSISLIKKYYPDITLVGNKKTLEMVGGFYHIDGNTVVVDDNSILDLGKSKLSFYLIPMVHWPETMVTFDETSRVIFSGDAFGCFGALNGGVIDTKINTDIYWSEMVRYYSNIVGKYGSPVQKAIRKIAHLPIEAICSTHGPVWTSMIAKVVEIYDRLSQYKSEDGVVIAYGSMYGNTEQMAEAIAEELSEQGVKNIVMHDVSRTHHSYIIADVFRYKGLIVGCPTYNNQMFPEMESLLTELANRDLKDRYFGYFGSFTWSSAAVKRITEFTSKLKVEVVGTPVDMKQGMSDDTYKACKELAIAMADKLNGKVIVE